MIELDGVEYTEQTAQENAYSLVTYINTYCAEHHILNSKGELVQIDTNPGNPLYMILFGFGYLVSILQKLLISVGNSFNIGRASDRQLLNIAEAANVKRIAPTKTTMNVLISCPLQSEQPCSITEDLSITYSSGNITLVMHPVVSCTIAPGESKLIVMQAETYAALSIPENVITGFDSAVPNIDSFYNYASVPAHEIESIANLRSRLQRRQESAGRIDKAIDAIRGLDGVAQCNIFYNYDYQNDSRQAGIDVPPRQALLIVQGYSHQIAETFYSYLACLTAKGEREDVVEQYYVTHSGQTIPVYIIPPTLVSIRVQVVLRYQLTDSIWQNVITDIQKEIATLVIGQELTNIPLITLIQNKYPDIALMSVKIFRVEDSPIEEIGERIFTKPYELLVVNESNISRGIASIND